MPADLKELRRLHEAATPGPWFEQYEYDGSRTVCQMRSTSETICVNRAIHVSGRPWESAKENGMLIAAACNALPELLDRIEALEAENARLRRVEEILRDNMDSCELRHADAEIRAMDGDVSQSIVRPRLTDEELQRVREEVAKVARKALEE